MVASRLTFLAGVLTGVALAVAPLAIANVPAAVSPAGRLMTQQVNRADKADRLKINVRTSSRKSSRMPKSATERPSRSHVIPDGCDSAFSPLSRAASLNYASRCLS